MPKRAKQLVKKIKEEKEHLAAVLERVNSWGEPVTEEEKERAKKWSEYSHHATCCLGFVVVFLDLILIIILQLKLI